MNIIPLNINTTDLPYLFLKFKTNVNTAISIDLITTRNITSGLYSEYVENNDYQAGYSYSNIYSSLYVINHYTSPGHYTCFVDNMLSELNYFNANKTVYYIAIRFYPLENNGTEYENEYGNPSVPPIMQWPEYNNLTISDISLSESYYSSINLNKSYEFVNGVNIYNITEMYYNYTARYYPDNYNNNSLYIINKNLNSVNTRIDISNIKYAKIDNEKYKVTLKVKSENLSNPLLIVFSQNYNPSWILLYNSGIVKYEHVLVDGSVNGYLIWISNSNISFYIYYSIQDQYRAYYDLGFLFYLLPPSTLLTVYVYKKFRHKK